MGKTTIAIAAGVLVALGAALTAQGRERPSAAHEATLHATVNEGHVPMFVEGYVVRVRVTRGASVVFRREVRAGQHQLISNLALPHGRYKLHVALHPCEGSCGALDPAWSHCSGEIEARANEFLGADVRMHNPHCRMLFSVGVPANG
jgi:hypothetical protein